MSFNLTLFDKKNNLINNLQQDIIKIDDKKIFLNPFLYSKNFDDKTNRWLRETGQISHLNILKNRDRFYPELKWEYLSNDEKYIKDLTVEFFLKTLYLINKYHPNLNSNHLIEIEKKLFMNKRVAFEKWIRKSVAKKAKLLDKEKRDLNKKIFIHSWKKWLYIKETKKAIWPVFVIIMLSFIIGWFAGVSKNSCNPYFESSNNNKL